MGLPAADTRTILLQAALECFSEEGFDRTSMRTIAERAKRPLSLLSHHFGNKEGLYLEVFRMVLSFMDERSGFPPPPEGFNPRTPEEAVRLLREQIHDIYRDCAPETLRHNVRMGMAMKLWVQELRAPRSFLVPLFTERTGGTMATLRNCIRKLRPELDEEEISFLGATILNMVVGHALLHGFHEVAWGGHQSPGNPFQAAESLMDFVLHGLRGLRADD